VGWGGVRFAILRFLPSGLLEAARVGLVADDLIEDGVGWEEGLVECVSGDEGHLGIFGAVDGGPVDLTLQVFQAGIDGLGLGERFKSAAPLG
jgi:hypothetical protein